ncbi:MAG: magnesium transporter [Acidobacteriota bacterium]
MDDFQVEGFREILRSDTHQAVATAVDLRIPELAVLLRSLTIEESVQLLKLLPLDTAVEVFDEPTLQLRREMVEYLDMDLVASIANHMSPDERADFFGNLDDSTQAQLRPRLNAEARAELEQLLVFPKTSAGGIMTIDFVQTSPTHSVAEAIERVRAIGDDVEIVYNIYVVEPGTARLLGVASLRNLLMAQPDQVMDEIMNDSPVTVRVDTDQEEVARTLSKYNLIAIPVVDAQNKILGIVTVDDVIDVLVEEGTEDLQRISAMEPLESSYFRTGLVEIVRKRAGWLVVLFFGELFTGTALRHYDSAIEAARVLVFFVPLIISSGGNSGSQSASLIIRGLATGEISLGQWARVVRRETISGLLLGLILGVIGLGRAVLWGNAMDVAAVVAITLVGVVAAGALVGAIMPLVLKRAGFDPAVSSTPFIASLVDVLGIVIYFSLAKWILGI